MLNSVHRNLSIALVLSLAPLSVAEANLIVNGSFEDPDIPFGTFSILMSIPGWTTTFGAGIEIQDHVAGLPYDGDQHVELDSFNNSGMLQTIMPTVPGGTYALSFAYSPRPNVAAEDNGIDVYFDGSLLASLQTSGIGLSQTSWTLYSYLVTATGSTASLEFRATGTSNSFGGYLDAVSFSAPEPSTLLFFALGLAGLGLRRRRA